MYTLRHAWRKRLTAGLSHWVGCWDAARKEQAATRQHVAAAPALPQCRHLHHKTHSSGAALALPNAPGGQDGLLGRHLDTLAHQLEAQVVHHLPLSRGSAHGLHHAAAGRHAAGRAGRHKLCAHRGGGLHGVVLVRGPAVWGWVGADSS